MGCRTLKKTMATDASVAEDAVVDSEDVRMTGTPAVRTIPTLKNPCDVHPGVCQIDGEALEALIIHTFVFFAHRFLQSRKQLNDFMGGTTLGLALCQAQWKTWRITVERVT